MERAPLRPVPTRPAGPVEPSDAIAHVESILPSLDAPARKALALVEIVGRSREEAAVSIATDGEEAAAAALARARTALRRSMFPLPGSGWCERAERLISDRLDGELEPPGPGRLDAHLRNCARCVEHERRLAQATDALVRGFVEAYPARAPVRAAPEAEDVPPGAEAEDVPLEPDAEDAPPEAEAADTPPVDTEDAPAEDAEVAPPSGLRVVPPPAAIESDDETLEPLAPVAPADAVATATPTKPGPGATLVALASHMAFALAVLFAIVTLVLLGLGIAGADPI
jgi:hypothetical protein